MEFQRIGKNTVQCHMSVEEMQEYGFAIEDFYGSGEIQRIFRAACRACRRRSRL